MLVAGVFCQRTKLRAMGVNIRGEITGECPWFHMGAVINVFAFEWEPYDQRSARCDIDADRVHIVTTYREKTSVEDVIYMERRLVDVDGERIAFHDALFVSETRRAQRSGFATEMLRRCVPYYRELGIEHVIIPSAVEVGRRVWPKFGFRPARHIAAQFELFAAELHVRKTGKSLPSPVPVQGPDILGFNGVYGVEVGVAALETFPGLALELDLTDPVTIDFLMKRGITVP